MMIVSVKLYLFLFDANISARASASVLVNTTGASIRWQKNIRFSAKRLALIHGAMIGTYAAWSRWLQLLTIAKKAIRCYNRKSILPSNVPIYTCWILPIVGHFSVAQVKAGGDEQVQVSHPSLPANLRTSPILNCRPLNSHLGSSSTKMGKVIFLGLFSEGLEQASAHWRRVLKLFSFPLHPPYMNRSHFPNCELKANRGLKALQGPVSTGREHFSRGISMAFSAGSGVRWRLQRRSHSSSDK